MKSWIFGKYEMNYTFNYDYSDYNDINVTLIGQHKGNINQNGFKTQGIEGFVKLVRTEQLFGKNLDELMKMRKTIPNQIGTTYNEFNNFIPKDSEIRKYERCSTDHMMYRLLFGGPTED